MKYHEPYVSFSVSKLVCGLLGLDVSSEGGSLLPAPPPTPTEAVVAWQEWAQKAFKFQMYISLYTYLFPSLLTILCLML